MSAVLIPAIVALTAIQVGSSMAQGSAQRKLAYMNADTEMRNAVMARQAGTEAGRLTRLTSREASGAAKVGFASGGIDVNSGTALDLRRSNEIQYELDALKAEAAGELQAVGYERSAQIQRYQGRLAQRFGYFGAGAAAMSGAARTVAAFERGRADTGPSGDTYKMNVLTGGSQAPLNPYFGMWQPGGFTQVDRFRSSFR